VIKNDSNSTADSKMKIIKTLTRKLLILAMIAVLPASWLMFDKVLNKTKTASLSVITANSLRHKTELARLKAKHKTEITKLKLKNKKNIAQVKVKERSKRLVAAIPIIGTASLLWTGKEEYTDYEEWLQDNPEGTTDEYVSYKTSLLIE